MSNQSHKQRNEQYIAELEVMQKEAREKQDICMYKQTLTAAMQEYVEKHERNTSSNYPYIVECYTKICNDYSNIADEFAAMSEKYSELSSEYIRWQSHVYSQNDSQNKS